MLLGASFVSYGNIAALPSARVFEASPITLA
jgi:hypothetical protein